LGLFAPNIHINIFAYMITAILIEAESQKVTLLEKFDCNLKNLYEKMNCKNIGIFDYEEHGFYYDDETYPEHHKYFWSLHEFERWIGGNTIIVLEQTDEEGKELSVKPNFIDFIKKHIEFKSI
jgi:hypothetical protein